MSNIELIRKVRHSAKQSAKYMYVDLAKRSAIQSVSCAGSTNQFGSYARQINQQVGLQGNMQFSIAIVENFGEYY